MKIALFTETFWPKIDGIVTRLIHTVDHLQRAGEQVLIFSPDYGIKEYKGARVYGVEGLPLPMYPELKMALPSPAIGRQLEQFKPDLIHVVNPAILGLGGIYYGKKFNIPILASYHTHLPKYLHHYGFGMLEPLLWELLKSAHNQAELNLCTSTAMVEELRTHGIDRVDLWQRGVDTEMFVPELACREMRSRLSENNPDSPLLLYVGRLGAEKEIESIKPVLAAIPDARLALDRHALRLQVGDVAPEGRRVVVEQVVDALGDAPDIHCLPVGMAEQPSAGTGRLSRRQTIARVGICGDESVRSLEWRYRADGNPAYNRWIFVPGRPCFLRPVDRLLLGGSRRITYDLS